MTMPSVAIVMPCFDEDPSNLAESVRSARTQTYANSELVIVDDGSSRPDTLRALKSLQEDGLRIIRQENGGPASARNAGIRASSVDFILPLDSDDIINTEFVSAAVCTMIETNPRPRFVYSDVERFGGVNQLFVGDPELRLHDIFATNRAASTALYDRREWERVGGYDEQLRHGVEDYDFWIRLLLREGFAKKAAGALLRYRIAPGRRSERVDDGGDATTTTRNRILETCSEDLPELVKAGWECADDLRQELERATSWKRALKRRVGPLLPLLRKARRRIGPAA